MNGSSVEGPGASNIVLKIKPSEIYLGRKISPIHGKILRDIADEKGIPVNYLLTIILRIIICSIGNSHNCMRM